MDELKDLVEKHPELRRIVEEHQLMQRQMDDLRKRFFSYPPGHFYSPIPSPDEIAMNADHFFAEPLREIPGVDLNESVQLEHPEAIGAYVDEQPFPDNKTDGIRYYFDNENFSYGDGYVLYGMIRHLQPK